MKTDLVRSLFCETVMVNVEFIHIDPGYQRVVNETRVRRICKNYDPILALPIVVGLRDDGTYWVVDGQHRFLAEIKRGQKQIACHVFKSFGREHEAKVFYMLNTERRGMSCIDIYKAMLANNEPDTVAIENLLASHGFAIGKTTGKFGGAYAVRQAYNCGCLGRILFVISQSWGSGSDRWKWMFGSSNFLQMMTHIYNSWGDVIEDERMISVLKHMPHERYQQLAAAHAGTTGHRHIRIAPEFIRSFYNNKLRKNRINLD